MLSSMLSFVFALAGALQVVAESHTIHFENRCGFGTPTLVQGGQILSTGEDFTSNGQFSSAIAYLNSTEKPCLLNGEGCMLLEMNMANPTVPGSGPSVDISLIKPHTFNFAGGFAFFGGVGNACDGLGAFCSSANCDTAFFGPNDNQVQRACQSDNVNLMITFCGGDTTGFSEASPNSLSDLDSGNPVAVSSSPPTKAKPSVVATIAVSVASSALASVTPAAVPVNVESSPPGDATSSSSSASSSSSSANAASGTSSSPGKTCRRRKPSADPVKRRGSNARAHARSRVRARAFGHH